jgi:hypothetical protein
MDEYFLTKKAVEIILENINDHFIKCLVSLSIQERYANDTKVIIGIIELLKSYMETRRNDILSSCIKYTNKSYYLHLTDNLFRLLQGHLAIARYVFITDLIDKYNHPVRHRCKTGVPDESDEPVAYTVDTDENTNRALIAKDAGTLFKDAYYKLKKTKMADVELQMMKEKKKDVNDLL